MALLRVAVIGTGSMGTDHIIRINNRMSGATISAIIEPDEKRAAAALVHAPDAKKFAIFGDEAIYEKAGGASFWEAAAAGFVNDVKSIDVTHALVKCIDTLSVPMQKHFPADALRNDNELADEIVFGK